MSKRNTAIIIGLALILFIFGQLSDLPGDLDDMFASILALSAFYFLFCAPVLAFICTALWQPRINRSVIDSRKTLDDNLYRFIIALQLLLFILFAAVNSSCGIHNWMVYYLIFHIIYNLLVLGTCLLSLLRKTNIVILCKVIIAAASMFVIAYNLILLVQCISY